MSHSILPPHLAVKAMRDNGYKNTAYALAELMDNSIQADATSVELLCGETTLTLDHRKRDRIHQIAVLDNGKGMNAKTLWQALEFGNGTHLEEKHQKGIGRFGMGLPASSMSQCMKVEVWSWQDGVENALYTHLDLEKIKNKEMTDVPEPEKKAIPDVWKKVGKSFGKTGTLVVWSTLDRLMWKSAPTIITNSEFVIGRMYRRFLEKGTIKIRMVGFDFDNPATVKLDQLAVPNDPGYLMKKTSTPSPFGDKAMFEKWGDEDSVVQISFRGKTHPVTIRYSIAKEEARQGALPGQRPHGKHAAKNAGLSIVRADRELELDSTWTNPSDPRDRWWGVEVDFPPALDELFGVTNNKQHAHNFSELAQLDLDSLLVDGKTIIELKEDMEIDEDPRGPLLEIAQQIQKNIRVMRGLLRAQTASEDAATRRHQKPSTAETKATEITKQRQEEGFSGQSDKDENMPDDQKQKAIEAALIAEGMPTQVAEELAASTVDNGLKYIFAEAELETSAFFSVKGKGGVIVITLNTNHPAYASLVEVLEKDTDSLDVETLQERLNNALDGLKLLLMAWARYEDEQNDGVRRTAAQDCRADWGRVARQFLETE